MRLTDACDQASVEAEAPNDLHPSRQPLRADDLSPIGPQRPAATYDLVRPLAELRTRPTPRDESCDRSTRVRPRHHALRPREQLRTPVRLGGGDFRPAAARR